MVEPVTTEPAAFVNVYGTTIGAPVYGTAEVVEVMMIWPAAFVVVYETTTGE